MGSVDLAKFTKKADDFAFTFMDRSISQSHKIMTYDETICRTLYVVPVSYFTMSYLCAFEIHSFHRSAANPARGAGTPPASGGEGVPGHPASGGEGVPAPPPPAGEVSIN